MSLVSVATKPTGLGLVTGLDPANRILQDRYEQIIAEYIPLSYDDIASQENEALAVIANDMTVLTDWLREQRLRAVS